MKIKQEEVIGECIMDNYQKLYRLAYSYVNNADDAMDIVQESAYKAIKSSCDVMQKEYIQTWIYRIVINTSLDLIRKKKKELLGIEDYLTDYEDQYPDIDLHNALNILNEKEKSIIILKFFEELKFSEIAEILNENVNTIKSIMYRALKKLKVELDVPIQI